MPVQALPPPGQDDGEEEEEEEEDHAGMAARRRRREVGGGGGAPADGDAPTPRVFYGHRAVLHANSAWFRRFFDRAAQGKERNVSSVQGEQEFVLRGLGGGDAGGDHAISYAVLCVVMLALYVLLLCLDAGLRCFQTFLLRLEFLVFRTHRSHLRLLLS